MLTSTLYCALTTAPIPDPADSSEIKDAWHQGLEVVVQWVDNYLLHSWFSGRVQNYFHDEWYHAVHRTELQQFLDFCKTMVSEEHREIAKEIYDEEFFDDFQNAIDKITARLNADSKYELDLVFYYRAVSSEDPPM